MNKLLVVGATAAMIQETVRRFASEGAAIVLAGRDERRCEELAEQLRERGAAAVHVRPFDASHPEDGSRLVDEANELLGGLDAVLVAHGVLSNQLETEVDPAALSRSLAINGLSVVQIAMRAALLLEARGSGCIAVITSGAGERGRRVTYTYGMAKSLVTTCLQGLRARLHRKGVSVVTVFPCFVSTPMTAGLPRRMRWIEADAAGARIHRAMHRGTDIVHIPRLWRLPLFLVRVLPEWWVKRNRTEQRFAQKIGMWPAEEVDR